MAAPRSVFRPIIAALVIILCGLTGFMLSRLTERSPKHVGSAPSTIGTNVPAQATQQPRLSSASLSQSQASAATTSAAPSDAAMPDAGDKRSAGPAVPHQDDKQASPAQPSVPPPVVMINPGAADRPSAQDQPEPEAPKGRSGSDTGPTPAARVEPTDQRRVDDQQLSRSGRQSRHDQRRQRDVANRTEQSDAQRLPPQRESRAYRRYARDRDYAQQRGGGPVLLPFLPFLFF